MYYRWTDPIDVFASEKDYRTLMPHQQDAVDSMNEYFKVSFENKEEHSGLVVMPTGSGKTFTAVNWLLNSGVANGYKIVWLVHRQDLITQTYYEFRKQASCLQDYDIKKLRIIPISGAHYNMSQASRYDINICSISSIANKYGYRFIRRMLGTSGLEKVIIVIDEAHHAVSPSYKKVIKRITELNPNRILLGLTATPTRMQDSDLRKLRNTFNANYNIINKKGSKKGYVYEETLKNLLINGSLAQPIYKRIDTKIIGEKEYSLTIEDEKYFQQFGELSESIKTKIAVSTVRNEIILNEYLENQHIYGKTLIFAVNQLHCKTLYKEFIGAGISCDYVISDKANSQQTISEFKENKFKVLINVQILTEGSDVPDIQTIFLTRQTNSDSLLMQMIGRGLRGPDYGGTKEANIIDFHDTWEKFSFWLDPNILFIPDTGQNLEKDLEGAIIENEGIVVIEKEEPIIPPINPNPDLYDIYLKIYNKIKSNVTAETNEKVFPDGWYSVINDEGEDYKVLVFDNQLEGYEILSKNVQTYSDRKVEAVKVICQCFDIQNNLPEEKEIQYILDMIYENKEMPDYYTFEQRNIIDPKLIAKEINNKFEKVSEKEEWLKELYENTPIIQELYKLFYIFKKTVFNSDQEKIDPIIETIDEREEFNIIDDYYNLDELLDDVIRANPFMNKDNLLEIRWSHKLNKSWYGLCQMHIGENGKEIYTIIINRLLSSPNIDKEVLKFIIYHEMLHKSGYWGHNIIFREKEWKYPNSAEHTGLLAELWIRYRLEEIFLIKRKYTTENKEDKEKVIVVSEVDNKNDNNKILDAKVVSINNRKIHKFCRHCGNKLPIESNFCDKCGSEVNY